MSWRSLVRSIQAEERRQRRALAVAVRQEERAVARRRRELEDELRRAQREEADALRRHERAHAEERRRSDKEYARQQAAAAAEREVKRQAAEAEQFANYLEVLVSLHKDCGHRWDWEKVARLARPEVPQPTNDHERRAQQLLVPARGDGHEVAARQALDTYVPGLVDRLLGRDKVERARLAAAIETAEATDEAAYQAALAAHARQLAADVARGQAADLAAHEAAMTAYQQRVATWEWFTNLAAAMRARQPEAYEAGLKYLVGFDELEELGNVLSLTGRQPDVIAIECTVRDVEVVPDEEVSLTAKGKLSTKKMAEGKRNALYQDFVCSSALRIAREVFALLPIDRVVVNIGGGVLDTSTGHNVKQTLLAVHFTRAKLEALNFDAIDASDAMKNFDHRMAFKKSTGMATVDPISIDEQWVTAG